MAASPASTSVGGVSISAGLPLPETGSSTSPSSPSGWCRTAAAAARSGWSRPLRSPSSLSSMKLHCRTRRRQQVVFDQRDLSWMPGVGVKPGGKGGSGGSMHSHAPVSRQPLIVLLAVNGDEISSRRPAHRAPRRRSASRLRSMQLAVDDHVDRSRRPGDFVVVVDEDRRWPGSRPAFRRCRCSGSGCSADCRTRSRWLAALSTPSGRCTAAGALRSS